MDEKRARVRWGEKCRHDWGSCPINWRSLKWLASWRGHYPEEVWRSPLGLSTAGPMTCPLWFSILRRRRAVSAGLLIKRFTSLTESRRHVGVGAPSSIQWAHRASYGEGIPEILLTRWRYQTRPTLHFQSTNKRKQPIKRICWFPVNLHILIVKLRSCPLSLCVLAFCPHAKTDS